MSVRRPSLFATAMMASIPQAAFGAAEMAPHPQRLCVLDQAQIYATSKFAVNEAKRFQLVRQQAQAGFDNDSRNIEADARALGNLRSALPPAVAKAKADEIATKRAQLQAKGAQINRNLAEIDSQLSASVDRMARPIVRQLELERGCSALLPRSSLIDILDPSIDITATVIARLDQAVGSGTPASR